MIGAGWAGLSAAIALVDAGLRVIVFEAGRVPGGRARRIEIDGAIADNGQHLLIGAYRHTLSTMHRIGVDSERVMRRIPFRVLVPGRMDLSLPRLPAPLHTLCGLLAAQGPSLGEKWRSIQAMRRLRASAYALPEDLTVARWLDANRLDGPLRRHLWEALCLAALNTPPQAASARSFAIVLRDSLAADRSATDLLVPVSDLGALLPDPACRWLRRHGAELRLGTRVRALAQTGVRWTVATDAAAEAFDQVVLATAPQHALKLLPDCESAVKTRKNLEAITYQPIATAYAHYPVTVPLPYPVIQLDDPVAQWIIARDSPGENTNRTAATVAHVLSAQGPWEALPDAQLAAALHGALTKCLPHLPAAITTRIVREKRATFSCTPGLGRPGILAGPKNLWLTGDYTDPEYPGTLEAAVRSGLATSQAIAAAVGAKSAVDLDTDP